MERLIKRYKSAKNNIEHSPELKSKIDEYRKLHIAFQKKAAILPPDDLPSLDEEKSVSSIYWELMMNDCAREFLESERELIQAAAQKIEDIANACELDGSFYNIFD